MIYLILIIQYHCNMNNLEYLKYNMASRGYSTTDITNTVNLIYDNIYNGSDRNLENVFINSGYKNIFEEFNEELYNITQIELINQHS
jgi:hypothetical protein